MWIGSKILMRSRRTAAALGVTALFCVGAPAAVTSSGTLFLSPDPGVPLGPGDVDLPDTMLLLGGGRRQASFAANAGSQVTLAYFNFHGDGLTTSTALLTGAGTVMRLAAPGNTNRFGLGNVGRASMTVSDGAVLDGRFLRERCDSGSACQNVVAAAAGSQGSLTVTGSGSEAHFIRAFHVASLGYNSAAGQRGQSALGTVNVLAGGLLSTELPVIGAGFVGNPLDGSERAIAQVRVAGTGSRWDVLGSAFAGGAVELSAALDPQASVQLEVEQGALTRVAPSPAGTQTQVRLGTGGQFDGHIAGTGSTLRIEGDGSNGALLIGANAGQSNLRISGGALLSSQLATVHVGRGEGQGTLRIEGAGTLAELGAGRVLVGDPGATSGTGWLQVTTGAMLKAGQVEIAPRGLLSGSGTVQALVLNAGTINPGDSPGTLTLASGYVNLPGGRLVLEVASDGVGGFAIDGIDFTGPSTPDLSDVGIVFSFLGAVDPAAFQAAGLFDIGSFLKRSGVAINPNLLVGAQYAARSDAYVFEGFSYSPLGGAGFTLTPVPEPHTIALWLTGLGALRWRALRRGELTSWNKTG